MPLSASERRIAQAPLFAAVKQVTDVLPDVTAEAEWALCVDLDGVWLNFKGDGRTKGESLCVDVIYFERPNGPGPDDARRDAWERGVVSFVSDGREEDTDPMERTPNLWRVCVLEELAAALATSFPKGAAELRKVAEYLRPRESLH